MLGRAAVNIMNGCDDADGCVSPGCWEELRYISWTDAGGGTHDWEELLYLYHGRMLVEGRTIGRNCIYTSV